MIANFILIPTCVLVVIQKLSFKQALLKLWLWFERYPQDIGGFMFTACGVSFFFQTCSFLLNKYFMTKDSPLLMRFAFSQLVTVFFIIVSSWLLLCLFELVLDLEDEDRLKDEPTNP
jgi:hypothetical protein